MIDPQGWYVIYTKPRHEKKVNDRLAEIGIHSFLPMTETVRTWSDRKKQIQVPLFPSYIFVHLEGLRNYYHSLKIAGVLNYVRMGDQIAKVSESVIRSIQVTISHARKIESYDHFIRPSRVVSILHGPLAGLCCEIIQLHGKQRVLVRVHLLKRALLLTLPPEYLIPANSQEIPEKDV